MHPRKSRVLPVLALLLLSLFNVGIASYSSLARSTPQFGLVPVATLGPGIGIIIPPIFIAKAIMIASDAAYANTTSVTLTLNATSLWPNSVQMRFSNDNITWTAWQSYGTSKSWTLETGEGSKTVYVSFKNSTGGTSPSTLNYQDSIILDTLPPTLTLTTSIANGTEISPPNCTVTWTATDLGSGIDHNEVSLDGGNWTSVNASTTYTFTGLTEGAHTFSIKAVDKSGKSQTSLLSVTVAVGVTASPSPTASPTPTPSPTPTASATATSSHTPTASASASPNATASPTPTVSPTPTPVQHEAAGFPIEYIAIIVVIVVVVVAVVIYKIMKRPKKPPTPTQLRLTAEPSDLIANGQAKSTVIIQLLDKKGKPVAALADTQVNIATPKGTLEKQVVTIPKGKDSEKTFVMATTESGSAPLSISAEGLKSSSVTLNFTEKKRYCMHCGALMPSKTGACANCGKMPPAGVDTKVCHNCKSVIPTVAKFCSECGTGQKE